MLILMISMRTPRIPFDGSRTTGETSPRKASAERRIDRRQLLTVATSCGVSFPDAAFYQQLVTDSIRLVSGSEKEGRPDGEERGGV
jgi:hypothetical protein